jgi:hypothetical protein
VYGISPVVATGVLQFNLGPGDAGPQHRLKGLPQAATQVIKDGKEPAWGP